VTVKCSTDPGYALFGAESMLEQLAALAKQIEGVREARDIEHIHRMRVASRRLRVRLALFADCFPAKKAADWRGPVRRLTRALGQARDADVQIHFLREKAEALGKDPRAPGVARVLLRLSQRREKLQARVVKALDRLAQSKALDEIEKEARRLRISLRLHPAAAAPSPEALAMARDAILPRLEEMLGFEIYVHEPEREEELHQMRIAAKRFRYAMEVFAKWYPRALKDELKAVRAIQETLGDVHDCDVWLEFLPRFLDEERSRAHAYQGHGRGLARLKPGIEFLTEDRREFRDRRYREFVETWEKAAREGRWTGLAEILEPPPRMKAEPEPEPAPVAEGSAS
jgi:CHAD domain-containing protein